MRAIRITSLLAATLAAALPAHAINKCTQPDGRVVYQDAPCGNAAAQRQPLKTWENSTGSAAVRPPAPGAAPQRVAPPRQIEFTGSPQIDLIKASAVMDSIRTIGRDCEWALKVDRSDLDACDVFLARLQPGGEFAQIRQRVAELLRDDPAAAQLPMSELRRLTLHTQDVVRYREFAIATLGSRGR